MSILAGTSTDAHTPPELFAGDAPVTTNARTVASGLELAANSIVAVNGSGELVKWDPEATDGTENAVGITCEDLDTTDGAAEHPIYEGGYFNTDALNWPDAATANQKANAFNGTSIFHRSLGYSG